MSYKRRKPLCVAELFVSESKDCSWKVLINHRECLFCQKATLCEVNHLTERCTICNMNSNSCSMYTWFFWFWLNDKFSASCLLLIMLRSTLGILSLCVIYWQDYRDVSFFVFAKFLHHIIFLCPQFQILLSRLPGPHCKSIGLFCFSE